MHLNLTFISCMCLQVVVTDVDECLEALHDNISANLPPHCTLVPECLAQSNNPLQPASTSDQQSDAVATCFATASPDVQGSHHQAHQDDLDSTEPACPPSVKPVTQSNKLHAAGDELLVTSLASMNLSPQSSKQNANKNHSDIASASASIVPLVNANPDPQNKEQHADGHHLDTASASAAPAASSPQDADGTSRATTATEVLVAELDWGRDTSALRLPFEVILIADVVSLQMFSMWRLHLCFLLCHKSAMASHCVTSLNNAADLQTCACD